VELSISHRSDHADLQSMDLLFAVCLHALVLTVVLMLNLWHGTYEFHPQSVEVSIISAEQLNKMIRQEQRHVEPAKHVAPPKPVEPEPKKQAVEAPKQKPQMSITKAAGKVKQKPEEPFDPFKPIESSTDVKSSTSHSHQQAADVFAGQLSKQEIDRYIARIQGAVQSHWKVPITTGDVHDPLVEMVLNPDGSVNSVTILESSGNPALDASLVRAIQAAAPFEVPARQFELFRDNRIRFHPLR
jgi:TonB family protein